MMKCKLLGHDWATTYWIDGPFTRCERCWRKNMVVTRPTARHLQGRELPHMLKEGWVEEHGRDFDKRWAERYPQLVALDHIRTPM